MNVIVESEALLTEVTDDETDNRFRNPDSIVSRFNSYCSIPAGIRVKHVSIFALIGIVFFGLHLIIASNSTRGYSSKVTEVVRKPVLSASPSDYICCSLECRQASSRIQRALNLSIDPCEDFYEFACGGWMAAQKEFILNGTKTSESQLGILSNELNAQIQELLERENKPDDFQGFMDSKLFYKACINSRNGNRLKENAELKNFIDYLIVDIADATHLQSSELGKTLGKIRRELGGEHQFSSQPFIGGNYLFSIGINFDFNDFKNGVKSPIYSLEVLPAALSGDMLGLRRVDVISRVWSVIYSDDTLGNIETSNLVVNRIVDLEIKLAEMVLASASTESEEILESHEVVSLDELSILTSNVLDWVALFRELYSGSSNKLDLDDLQISVFKVYDLRKLHFVLKGFTMTEIRNYLKWRILFDLAYTNSDLRDALNSTEFHTFYDPSPTSCASRTVKYFSAAMTYAYVQTYFGDNFKDQLTSMVADLKQAFDDLLYENQWLEASDIEVAKKKIQTMRLHLAYPNALDNLMQNKSSTQNSAPPGLRINPANSFLRNTLDGIKFESLMELQKLGTRKAYDEWGIMSPFEVNAAYEPLLNTIILPAAILQVPFHGNPLEYLNFGAIGSIIGHEITHGFDTLGKYYDEDGTFKYGWSNWTTLHYEQEISCFKTQYDMYRSPDCNISVDGTLTLDENIADNGGVRQAYKAYQNYVRRESPEKSLPGLGFTPHQLFFISFAQAVCEVENVDSCKESILEDSHSPGRFRIRGSLHNFDEFHKTWNCRPPAAVDTCRIW